MSDLKPPRVAADERATVMTLLQFQRESFLRKVADLSERDAASSPVATGTSLLWLTNHVADAESTWVLRRFARRPVDDAVHAESITDAAERYRRVWARVDEVVRGSDLDDECPTVGTEAPVNLRWILLHLLEETARHAGHADILRELIDGSIGR